MIFFVQGAEKMVEYIYVMYNTYSLSMKDERF